MVLSSNLNLNKVLGVEVLSQLSWSGAYTFNEGSVSDEALDGVQDEVQLLTYLSGNNLNILYSRCGDKDGGKQTRGYCEDGGIYEEFNEGKSFCS